jgi:hypothetical protein
MVRHAIARAFAGILRRLRHSTVTREFRVIRASLAKRCGARFRRANVTNRTIRLELPDKALEIGEKVLLTFAVPKASTYKDAEEAFGAAGAATPIQRWAAAPDRAQAVK